MSLRHPTSCLCCGALDRRRFMLAAGGGIAALALSPRFSLADETVPAIAYDSVRNPLHLPRDIYFGEVSGVALNSKGHVFVLSRGNTTGPAYGAAATQLLEFGAGRPIPARDRPQPLRLVVRAYREGRSARQHLGDRQGLGHGDQVHARRPRRRWCSAASRRRRTRRPAPLKHPNPPLPAEHGRFRQVTDVAWDAAGNTYISDGYINSRVAKVDKDGNWLEVLGRSRHGPGPVPHAAQHRGRRQGPRLCRRPQQPAHPGVRRRRQIPAPVHHRRAGAARRAAGDRQHARRGGDRRRHLRARLALGDLHLAAGRTTCSTAADAFPGRIYKLTLDGKLLGMLGQSGKQLKQFGWIHEMACPAENVLYVAELLNWRVQKLVLHT